jgi:hypothetical protein
MIRITASTNRDGLGAEVTIEMPDGDAGNIGARVIDLWRQLGSATGARVAPAAPVASTPAGSNGRAPAPTTNGKPSETPAATPNGNGNGSHAPATTNAPAARPEPANGDGEHLSQKQRGFILGLGAKLGMKLPQLHERSRSMFGGKSVFELSRKDASTFIDVLREDEGENGAAA